MGSTQKTLAGTHASSVRVGVVPSRSQGPTGHQDAADPNALVCLPGDTPGPAGTNGDSGEDIACAPHPRVAKLQVLEVDLDRAEHFLYSVAYAHAADTAAQPGFFASDEDFGSQPMIEASARAETARLLYELVSAMTEGSEAVQRFMAMQADRKAASLASMNNKLRESTRAGQRSVERWGLAIKTMAGIRFTSTVVLKVASIFAPPAGAAVDISYDVAQEGIDYVSKRGSEGAADVVIAKTITESVKAVGEMVSEMLTDGLLTRREAEMMEDWLLKGYRGDRKELIEKVESLAERLKQAMAKGKGGAKLARKYGKQLEKIGEKLSRLDSTMAKGFGKKALGKGLSVLFVAQDIREAWGDMVVTWNQSN